LERTCVSIRSCDKSEQLMPSTEMKKKNASRMGVSPDFVISEGHSRRSCHGEKKMRSVTIRAIGSSSIANASWSAFPVISPHCTGIHSMHRRCMVELQRDSVIGMKSWKSYGSLARHVTVTR
jgi:hypothetical protein